MGHPWMLVGTCSDVWTGKGQQLKGQTQWIAYCYQCVLCSEQIAVVCWMTVGQQR